MRLYLCCLVLCIGAIPPAHSAQWVTLKHQYGTRLSIDKQSITQDAPYIKAWVKADYQTPQKNIESVDRTYNNAKALWYFDCAKQKAATIQVFQYHNQELVYSAGIEPKKADFIEPLPESEVDIAKQYVCEQQALKEKRAQAKKEREAQAKANANIPPDALKPDANNASVEDKKIDASKPDEKEKSAEKEAVTKKQSAKEASSKKEDGKVKDKKGSHNAVDKKDTKVADKVKKSASLAPDAQTTNAWSYQGETGPAQWASLDPQYAQCATGKNQSPTHLQHTIPAALKPLKMLQKFPAKAVTFNAHAIQVQMGVGNMMVLDRQPYQLKEVVLHSPAEHQIKQKQYAAEVQLVHQNKQGDTVIVAVMVQEGAVHTGLDKVLQMPIKAEMKPLALKARLTPAEFMPTKKSYIRYSGSLTTPPCTEGVQWIVMKAPIAASKQQLTQLSTLLGGANNRPIQEASGRIVLE